MQVKIKVPVDANGDFLRPEYRQGNGYHVGMNKVHVAQKGLDECYLEKYHDDYFAALKDLTSRPKPQWRRPNEKGNWGLVTATDWKWVEFEVAGREFRLV